MNIDHVNCEHCGRELSDSEALQAQDVDGEMWCVPCANTRIRTPAPMTACAVLRQVLTEQARCDLTPTQRGGIVAAILFLSTVAALARMFAGAL